MNLESLTHKQLNEVERLLTELTNLMKRARLTDDPLYATLTELTPGGCPASQTL